MSGQISVSMYNVGFGDCFLVQIPVGETVMRILFDCGRHQGGAEANQALADSVIAAATDPLGKARIDLIVATHRHKDHVSGFAARGWDAVEVREVWMPWTENPADPAARGLAARQVEAARMALDGFRRKAALDPVQQERMGLMGLALSNEAAMDTLYHGFAGDPVRRYLPDKDNPLEPFTLAGFPGVSFHVLGPGRNEAMLAVMDPPKAETFRKLAASEADGGGDAPLTPFPAAWRRAPDSPGPTLSPDQEEAVGALSGSAGLEALSAAVDQAINNTSLVVMVEAGTACLLFCADAQWGNWQGILAEKSWCELIGRTTFLKVGHHASHNASPVTLIDTLLPEGIAAMVSVDPKAYSSVPFPKLLDAFTARKFEVARSDEWQKAGPRYQGDADVVTLKIDMGMPDRAAPPKRPKLARRPRGDPVVGGPPSTPPH